METLVPEDRTSEQKVAELLLIFTGNLIHWPTPQRGGDTSLIARIKCRQDSSYNKPVRLIFFSLYEFVDTTKESEYKGSNHLTN